MLGKRTPGDYFAVSACSESAYIGSVSLYIDSVVISEQATASLRVLDVCNL